NFILKPGNMSYFVGTGGTTFDHLQQHITDTECARLKESYGLEESAKGSPDIRPMFKRVSARLPTLVDDDVGFWDVDTETGLLATEPMPDLTDK
ncbi:unnamed protein product, partial [Polarella glacialis]